MVPVNMAGTCIERHLLLVCDETNMRKHVNIWHSFRYSPKSFRNLKHSPQVVGTGGSQAQVTATRPRLGSANCLKAPGLTSRSVG